MATTRVAHHLTLQLILGNFVTTAMYGNFNVLVIFILALALYSCQSQSAGSSDNDNDILSQCDVVATRDIVNGDTLINCHINRVDYGKTLRMPLSSLVDSLRVIPLESSEEALIGIGTCDFSENYSSRLTECTMALANFSQKMVNSLPTLADTARVRANTSSTLVLSK